VVAARPLQEPVARYGPFVMNRRAEIEQALEDLRTGKFMSHEENPVGRSNPKGVTGRPVTPSASRG